jgi:hypothetical protein
MAEPTNLDPFGLWRDMLGQWERGVNSVANQAMGSDEFSRAVHQITTVSLRMQQTMGEVLGKTLQTLNLPTRSDILALNERIGRIEDSLARLEAAAVPAETPTQAAPRPPRTRQPPAP